MTEDRADLALAEDVQAFFQESFHIRLECRTSSGLPLAEIETALSTDKQVQ
jgi:hypothetical protein